MSIKFVNREYFSFPFLEPLNFYFFSDILFSYKDVIQFMRLKDLRKNAHMTQVQLAKELHVAPNTLCNWENGNRTPDAETLKRIADYFDVTVDYLLDYDSETFQRIYSKSKIEAAEGVRDRILESLEFIISGTMSASNHYNLISNKELVAGIKNYPAACELLGRVCKQAKQQREQGSAEQLLSFYALCFEDFVEFLSNITDIAEYLEMNFPSGNVSLLSKGENEPPKGE